jgi:hypothetical protein
VDAEGKPAPRAVPGKTFRVQAGKKAKVANLVIK